LGTDLTSSVAEDEEPTTAEPPTVAEPIARAIDDEGADLAGGSLPTEPGDSANVRLAAAAAPPASLRFLLGAAATRAISSRLRPRAREQACARSSS
jgi:hypothetical protein